MIKAVFYALSRYKTGKWCCRRKTFLIRIIYLCYHTYKLNYRFFKQNKSQNSHKDYFNINKLPKSIAGYATLSQSFYTAA